MRRSCWLSVDFDFFVRSLGAWDWSHKESPFFRSGFIWQTRVAPFLMQGIDLREEMDPLRHARPIPSSFWKILDQLGYDFSDTQLFVVSDSHAAAGPTFDQVAKEIIGEPAEVLVSFDAHHDLGYHDWSMISDLSEKGECTCDMWLCALMQWWKDFETRIVFPDWMREEGSMDEQFDSVRGLLPQELLSRVKMDYFTQDDGTISPLVSEPGEVLDVQAVFACRSGAWVPPWLDQGFIDYISEAGCVIGLDPITPFDNRDMPALELRTDFRYDDAVKLAEQWRSMHDEYLKKVRSSDRD